MGFSVHVCVSVTASGEEYVGVYECVQVCVGVSLCVGWRVGVCMGVKSVRECVGVGVSLYEWVWLMGVSVCVGGHVYGCVCV